MPLCLDLSTHCWLPIGICSEIRWLDQNLCVVNHELHGSYEDSAAVIREIRAIRGCQHRNRWPAQRKRLCQAISNFRFARRRAASENLSFDRKPEAPAKPNKMRASLALPASTGQFPPLK